MGDHLGAAKARGIRWAERVAKEMRRQGKDLPPWPAFGGKVMALATKHTFDLFNVSDENSALIRACYEAAQRQYEELRQGAATPIQRRRG
jgi:hypothetical protein